MAYKVADPNDIIQSITSNAGYALDKMCSDRININYLYANYT